VQRHQHVPTCDQGLNSLEQLAHVDYDFP
jgi:hypothetical protein